MNVKKKIGVILRIVLPRKIYKLIANGFIIVPGYYRNIIKDAEINYELSVQESPDKEILMMRKYAHILDKGLHRQDIEPGHSREYYLLLKESVERLKGSKYEKDATYIWAKEKISYYELLQKREVTKPLTGTCPKINVSFDDLTELVKARRSNRNFSKKRVSTNDINRLKKLANWASSSCNKQPIEIYVADDPDIAKQCLKCCKGGTGFSDHIPTFWAFTCNILGYIWPSEIYLPTVDVCLGVQNVMLGATSLKMSGTLLSWAQKDEQEEKTLKKLLGIPQHHQIIICAVIGYAETEFSTPERKSI